MLQVERKWTATRRVGGICCKKAHISTIASLPCKQPYVSYAAPFSTGPFPFSFFIRTPASRGFGRCAPPLPNVAPRPPPNVPAAFACACVAGNIDVPPAAGGLPLGNGGGNSGGGRSATGAGAPAICGGGFAGSDGCTGRLEGPGAPVSSCAGGVGVAPAEEADRSPGIGAASAICRSFASSTAILSVVRLCGCNFTSTHGQNTTTKRRTPHARAPS
ncbi:hypothetical protein HYPSUDRAFT_962009 [Hypholoma sublateritium FD-334 SS-4]|uniref:Uncharacterized protein n=1 Tax=Hypholoma sublateritium (strain FD-334 SS-4) TaxID=945553 RepID=A0A0D2NNC1_HYPSF|nr:hypothetical protein HYPSUDRAFT_962009 [Hypholoma sublateritium FD-334 SS-4]